MRLRKDFPPTYPGLRFVPAALAFALHQTRIALGDMIFFVRQVEYYCHLEVVACQWKELEDFISKKDGDLDKLIEAHRRYVTTMVDKALLRASGRRKKEAKPLFDQLRDIFKVMLQHKNVAVRAPSGMLAETIAADDSPHRTTSSLTRCSTSRTRAVRIRLAGSVSS